MLKEIKKQYDQFLDSTVFNFNYSFSSINNKIEKKIEVIIYCANIKKDYKWEFIKITFIDLIKYRFIQTENISNGVIESALLKEENGIIFIDFFPILLDLGDLDENPNSRFSIHCKKIEYEVIGPVTDYLFS
jgi:hypothetical protein